MFCPREITEKLIFPVGFFYLFRKTAVEYRSGGGIMDSTQLSELKSYVMAWLQRYHGYSGAWEQGLRGDFKLCPVARMLSTAHQRRCHVGENTYNLKMVGSERWAKARFLPNKVVEFVRAFDSGLYPELIHRDPL